MILTAKKIQILTIFKGIVLDAWDPDTEVMVLFSALLFNTVKGLIQKELEYNH